jgi:hypothetical protein
LPDTTRFCSIHWSSSAEFLVKVDNQKLNSDFQFDIKRFVVQFHLLTTLGKLTLSNLAALDKGIKPAEKGAERERERERERETRERRLLLLRMMKKTN